MGKKLYQKDQRLSVTITFAPAMQELNKSYLERKQILDSFAYKMITNLYKKGGAQAVVLYREITWYGLIHYHGVIVVDSPRILASTLASYAYQKTGKSLVNIDLDSIEHMDKWYEYITKDKDEMGLPLSIGVIDDVNGNPDVTYDVHDYCTSDEAEER